MATGYETWAKDKTIELRTINENNYTDCLNLKASVANTNFVDSVAYSLAEAWVHYKDTTPFAIYADETMIGFVSMYVGEELSLIHISPRCRIFESSSIRSSAKTHVLQTLF